MEFNGTFFATIITFIVFVFVMNKILYAPILKVMEEREEFIRSNYKEADDNNAKSDELTQEKAEKQLLLPSPKKSMGGWIRRLFAKKI